MGTLQKESSKFYLSFLIMEYYSKREYNQMKKSLENKIKLLSKKVDNLTKELKKTKDDYEVLPITATETEESED